MKFDRAEREILRTLQAEGRISNVELAERIGLSESPCFRRVKRLEDSGLITGIRSLSSCFLRISASTESMSPT